MDSLGAVELRNTLETQFSLDLPATLTFDYPTISALAGYLASHLMPVSMSERLGKDVPIAQDFSRGSTAIVSIACR